MASETCDSMRGVSARTYTPEPVSVLRRAVPLLTVFLVVVAVWAFRPFDPAVPSATPAVRACLQPQAVTTLNTLADAPEPQRPQLIAAVGRDLLAALDAWAPSDAATAAWRSDLVQQLRGDDRTAAAGTIAAYRSRGVILAAC
jgi:hypothetical protein